ncbi:hemolysin D [Xenorhabdus kozodoii]|uniref:Hemolysin D n=1 Tax=Xenorhabdus kozodoii TaxID=351676 RepID=A0A2D0L882_9GAMM|nr:hemolysin D [Xenorhabdus kozodoii]
MEKFGMIMIKNIKIIIVISIILLSGIYFYWYFYWRFFQTTNNAYVQASITNVNSRLSAIPI